MQKSQAIEPAAIAIENAGSAETPDKQKTQSTFVDPVVEEYHVKLGWRSWLVVFIICFV
jgi:hypothetical protein